MGDEQKKKDIAEEHADNDFWESVEQITRNIIKVVKDTIRLIQSENKKPS